MFCLCVHVCMFECVIRHCAVVSVHHSPYARGHCLLLTNDPVRLPYTMMSFPQVCVCVCVCVCVSLSVRVSLCVCVSVWALAGVYIMSESLRDSLLCGFVLVKPSFLGTPYPQETLRANLSYTGSLILLCRTHWIEWSLVQEREMSLFRAVRMSTISSTVA